MKDMVGSCCVCSDDRGWPENPLVYCDGQSCTVAVHQACYGIVTVPTGPWYCRKCESQERSVKVKCELCPSRYGALKRTDNAGWAHVVCALYIPEVRFGNVTTMEPIQLQLIPAERFTKVCYICEVHGKPSSASVGACMQCNKSGCKQQFHVTCAQSLGLLCEEAGNYLDNVKYCGYCQHHYSKLKKGGNVKTIPPYKPIAAETPASDSSSEKEEKSKRKASSASLASNKTTTKTSPARKTAAAKDECVVETVAAVVENKTEKETERDKGKKRKANSRTPTPSIASDGEASCATLKKEKDVVVVEKKSKSFGEQTAVIQATTAIQPPALPTPPPPPPQLNSVVVSVPLHNTSLSPCPSPSVANIPLPDEKSALTPPPFVCLEPDAGRMLASELTGGGGLKITFEKQAGVVGDELDFDQPVKRSRSQSAEKSEKSKSKKRGSNGLMTHTLAAIAIRKSGKSSSTPPQPPPMPVAGGGATFVNLAAQHRDIKDSPPSSPSSESLGAPPVTATGKKRGRKSNAQLAAQAAAARAAIVPESPQQPGNNGTSSSSTPSSNGNKDTKDNIKLFQNGVNAPHMLGNQLNMTSNMAQKMTDHLNSELEAHGIFSSGEGSNLVGPPLQHRVIASARSNSVGGSSTASGGSGLSSMLSGGGTIPQTLDQLLERQWEQGSQFLMEQAQHFDIASLLSCLHQLRAENLRLEEHVNSLLQRRDHLLAVNARLAIPLTPPATPQSTHTHTVNNIHPAVSHAEASRPRHSGSAYPPHVQGVPQHPPAMENGIAPDAYPHAHRSPAGTQPPQPSPRQSSSGYVTSGFSRQGNVEAANRGHRSTSNQFYNTPPGMQLSNTQQQQVVIRSDHAHLNLHHASSNSKANT